MKTAGGTLIELASKLGEGADGVVYAVKRDGQLAVKLQPNNEPLTPFRRRRLERLIALRLPEHPHGRQDLLMCWPRELVLDDRGRAIGFTMRRALGRKPVKLAKLLSFRDREKLAPNLSFQTVMLIGAGLALIVAYVHALGLVLCDLNERNVIVAGTEVSLIDLDSVQFVDSDGELWLSPWHTEDNLPPELYGVDLNAMRRTVEHDRYTLAVLTFRVLMLGRHPHDGRRADQRRGDLQDQASRGVYAYGPDGAELTPPRAAPPIGVIPADARNLFETTFTAGARHPSRRADAATLAGALLRGSGQLTLCDGARGHLRPNDARACPWCAWERQIGLQVSAPAPRVGASPLRPAPRRPASPIRRAGPMAAMSGPVATTLPDWRIKAERWAVAHPDLKPAYERLDGWLSGPYRGIAIAVIAVVLFAVLTGVLQLI